MAGDAACVLHILASDCDALTCERLSGLLAAGPAGLGCVQIGGGQLVGVPGVMRLTPVLVGGLMRRGIRNWLAARARGRGVILHCWSEGAARVALPLIDPEGRGGVAIDGAIVEAASGAAAERVATLVEDLAPARRAIVVVPTDAAAACIRGKAGDYIVVRDAITAMPDERAADRGAVRAAMNLHPEHDLILVLPPVERSSGAFLAAWATLLVEKIRPTVRLCVPGLGREVERVRHLVVSCQQREVLLTPGDRFSLAGLLIAADITLFLPAQDAPVGGLVRAMAAGSAVLASDVSAVREFVTHETSGRLCSPTPRDAARELLRMLEDPAARARCAAGARDRAAALPSAAQVRQQYDQAYRRLIR
jgi:hypothetical protein